MKKFLTFILAFTMSLTLLGSTGCKNNTEDSSSMSPVQVEERLEFEKTNILLTVGDRVELPVSYNALEDGVFTWTSSDPNVASVDGNGYVEGMCAGLATITVRYGSKEVSCKVEVSLSGNVPVLAFDNDVSETVSLMKGETFGFGAHVRFNGKEFTDAEIDYYVADEAVGTMENGAFVAKNIGSTQVSIFATWRGQTVHAKTITVNVVTENSVLLNGGRLKDITLYTAAEHEGASYATSQTISSVYISEDGVQIDEYELTILDSGIASLEKRGEIWEINALKSGKTNLIVSYGDVEFPFSLTVERPTFISNKKVEYSLADGQYFDENAEALKDVSQLFDGFGELISYQLDGKEYKARDGKINLSAGKDITLTLYNQTVGYQITVDAYTMILDELADFENIYAGDTKKNVEGTYILGKDIIEPTTVLKMPEGKVANNFAGMFDGRGHVLSFTFEHGTTHRFGLFGEYLNNATIKNLALNNVTMDGTTGKNAAGIICGEGAQNGETSPESTIENVFVNLKFSTARDTNLVFMGNAMWKTIMKNVIIHVPEVPVSDTYGSFARGDSASVSNSYIISNAPAYVTTTETNFKKVPTVYANYTEMLSAGNDYSSFDTEYWDVTTYGVPVWKTLSENFTL